MNTVQRVSVLHPEKADDPAASRKYLNVAPYLGNRASPKEAPMSPPLESVASIENRLLTALFRNEYELLARSLEPVRYPRNKILYEAGDTMRQAIFINRGMASVLAITDKGEPIDVGTVGREGFVGVPLILRADKASYRVMAQTRIEAVKIDSEVLREHFSRSGKLQEVLLGYANVLQTQAVQAVVCRPLHTLEQRLSRRLLVIIDCLDTDVFNLTHEQIATVLGRHRNRVGVVARGLQEEGLIELSRGSVKILDRQGLRAAACECYRIVKECMDAAGEV